MAHTPGPWTVEDFSRQPQILAGKNCERTLAEVYTHGDKDRFMSDARLMAAAPELLLLVKRLREVFEQLSDGDWRHLDATYVDQLIESDGLHACTQAIAKAEGRTDEN